jgi:hypothetical protein
LRINQGQRRLDVYMRGKIWWVELS